MGANRSHAGRRNGESKTREAILEAAQQLFAERGYDHATMQAIAAVAGVDAALIVYFFNSKQQLFVEAVTPNFHPEKDLVQVLAGDLETVGQRCAEHVVNTLENPIQGKIILGLVRAAVVEPATTMLRDNVEAQIAKVIAAAIPRDDAAMSASLVCSIYLGFVMARYVTQIEPLASASRVEAVQYLAPLFQQCFSGFKP